MKKVRGLLFTIGICLLSQTLVAQPYFDWAKSIAGVGASCYGYDVVVDGNENTYVSGAFTGTVDFDPGPGVFNLTSTGITDAFVAKYNSMGDLVWAKITVQPQSSTDRATARHIQLDNNGNIIIGGAMGGTVDVDPGSGAQIQTTVGSYDWYVQKLDNSGNLVWANSTGSTAADDLRGIAISPNGDVYICGYFAGTTDFDPGIGTFNLTPNNSGWEDAFLYKLDAAGNFVWAKSIQGTSGTYGWAVAVDGVGDVCLSGSFLGTADLNPNAGTQNETSIGSQDMFIIKLTSAGLFSWAKAYGGSSNVRGENLEIDNSGNLLISGFYQGTVDLNPGAGTWNETSVGSWDIFIQKLDLAGNFIWGGSIGGSNSDTYSRLQVDSSNDIYMSGRYSGTMDFDPTAATFNVTSAGGNDSYVEKISSNGTFIWLADQRGSSNVVGTGIAVFGNNYVYLTGGYDGTIDFDHTASTSNHTAVGTGDGFLLKLSQCLTTSSTINPSTCTSYTSPSGSHTWTTSNTYMDTVMNAGGCDSIITINLTITGPSNSTDILTECDSVLWIDGNTYYSNNTTATHTIVNGAASGCDSIVTLNLTINNATNGTAVQTACGSFLWIDNNTYTSNNNTATHTIANGAASGCDSIVTLNLTINNADTSVTKVSPMLTANAAGANYRWLDCNNNYVVIAGATNQNFTPSVNGSYAVEVTENGCTDTSSCYSIVGIGIGENNLSRSVSLYPNPTSGVINIALGNQYNDISIQVKDVTGKLIDQKNYQGTDRIEYNLKGESGIYFIELTSAKGERTTLKIIKQ